jgi:hypothetical protein
MPEAKFGQASAKSAGANTLATAASDPFEDLAALNLAAMVNASSDNTVAR